MAQSLCCGIPGGPGVDAQGQTEEKVLAHEADRPQQHPSPPRGGPQVGEGGVQHWQLLQYRCSNLQHRPALLGLEGETPE